MLMHTTRLKYLKWPCWLAHILDLQAEYSGYFTHWRSLIGLWQERGGRERRLRGSTIYLWFNSPVKIAFSLGTKECIDHSASKQFPLLQWQHRERSSLGVNNLKCGPIWFHFTYKAIEINTEKLCLMMMCEDENKCLALTCHRYVLWISADSQKQQRQQSEMRDLQYFLLICFLLFRSFLREDWATESDTERG